MKPAKIDLSGIRYGKLTVVEYAGRNNNSEGQWLCKCDCGGERLVVTSHLRSGHTTRCKLCKRTDEKGRKYGYLTVISEVTDKESKVRSGARWLCRCVCGNEKVIPGTALRKGNLISCGCKRGTYNLINEVGNRYGGLVVTERVDDGKRAVRWECICDCGKRIMAYGNELRNGIKADCGCTSRKPVSEIAFNRYLCTLRHMAKSRNYSFLLSREQVKHINKQNCYYCNCPPTRTALSRSGKRFTGGEYLYNGIDRIDNKKGYEIDNVVPCCLECNTMKRDSSLDDFLDRITAIYKHRVLGGLL